jgi:zinc/manganese transport system permease protein
MEAFLETMMWPFAACLVLAGIHAYLGMHVIERGVIFVDLALAQIAALGTGLALIAGFVPESPASYWASLGFTLIGATVFSFTRFRSQKVPQEAVIGIVYAVSAACLVLVLSRSAEGDELIRQSLVGNILLVPPGEVLHMGIVYAAAGVFHYVFRTKFLAISRDAEAASASGVNVRLWDFLFYASFGLVVTCSVHVAGVLLVFTYLVVPASAAVLFTHRTRTRLWLGWGVGLAGSVLGMAVSYFFDMPTGASVVCVFGAILVLAGSLRAIIKG